MRVKLDENFGGKSVRLVLAAGHDVSTVREEGLAGAPDEEVYRACIREGRTLLTLDLDFSNPLRFPPEATEGILVVRPRRLAFAQIEGVLRVALSEAEKESVKGRVWIVESTRVRKHGRGPADEEAGGGPPA